MKEYNIEPNESLGTCVEDTPCHIFWQNHNCNDIVGGSGGPNCQTSTSRKYAVNLDLSI